MTAEHDDPSEPSSSADETAPPGEERLAVWKDYPIGVFGKAAQAVQQITLPFGLGLLLVLILDFVIGLLYEEDVIYNVLSNRGMTYSVWEPISRALDLSTRGVIGPALVLGYVTLVVACVATCVSTAATSRGLVKAARAGASRYKVPSPSQVEAVITRRFWALWGILLLTAGILALFGCISLFMALDDSKPSWASYGVILLAGSAVVGGLAWVMDKTVHPAHRHRRAIIASWWTTADEQRAWKFVHASERQQCENESLPVTVTRDRRLGLSSRILGLGGTLFTVSVLALFAVVFVMYPHGNRFDAGERADLSPEFESFLRIVLVIVLAGVAVSFVGMLVGNLIEGAGRRAERAALRRVAKAFDPMRIAPELLEEYSERRAVLLATILVALGGMLFVVSVTMLLLSGTDNDVFRDASVLFSEYVALAVVVLAISVGFVTIGGIWNAIVGHRDTELRNSLMARWPKLPTDATEKADNGKRRTIPARVGPALTPGTEQKRIVSESENPSAPTFR